MALSYAAAKSQFARAKDPVKGKSLDSRTKLRKNRDHTYSVYFNNKNILTIRPDGKYVVNAMDTGNGWGISERVRKYSASKGVAYDGSYIRPFAGAVIGADGKITQSSMRKNGKVTQASIFAKSDRVAKQWLKDTHGITVEDGRVAEWLYTNRKHVKEYRVLMVDGKPVQQVKLHKCTMARGQSGRGNIRYVSGKRIVDPNYRRHNSCGQGLHFSQTKNYASGYVSATQKEFLRCWVDIDTMCRIGQDKIKSQACNVI